jgi:type IV pilus assembly protein PilN
VIRINLLGAERQKAKKSAAFDIRQSMTLAGALVLVVAAAGNGWWFWSLTQTTARLEAETAAAQTEATRLRGVLTEVEQFEARRAQLQQRVALIEDLRSGQSVPVQLLDLVSRSLPEMLWLTGFEQDGDAVTIEGRSTTLIGLSDFVGNLAANPLLKKPVEIVDSQVENTESRPNQPAAELIKFTVKAQLAPVAASDGKGGRGGRSGGAKGGAR